MTTRRTTADRSASRTRPSRVARPTSDQGDTGLGSVRLEQALQSLEDKVYETIQESLASELADERAAGSSEAQQSPEALATALLSELASRVQRGNQRLTELRDNDRQASDVEHETPVAVGKAVSLTVRAVPVLPDGSPHIDAAVRGMTTSVTPESLTFTSCNKATAAHSRWVIGVEFDDCIRYTSGEVAGEVSSSGELTVVASDRENDLFQPRNLLPKLDYQDFYYRAGLTPSALAQWTELGVLRQRLMDRVVVCPHCEALPTVRSACQRCGSVAFHTDRLIHHFACAHVGDVDDFDHDGQLICPNCRVTRLLAGTDFEYLDGPYECRQCGASASSLALQCQCLNCDARFPITEAVEKDLVAHDVDRLDLLALHADA